MLKRFLGYYRPHLRLFVMDIMVAFLSVVVSVIFPLLTRKLLNTYLPSQNTRMIVYTLSMLGMIVVIKTACTYVLVKWGHILGARMEYDMRAELFRHIQKLSFTYFDNVKTGHLMTHLSSDLNLIVEIAHHAPEDIIIFFFMFIGAFGVMFAVNAQLALVAFVPVGLMIWWVLFYGSRMHKGFRNILKKIADINSTVENSVQGIREVKSYANEELEIRKFESANTHFKSAKENIYGVLGKFYTGMRFLTDSYYLAVIAFGVFLIYRGKLGLPDLVAFLLYVTFILEPNLRWILNQRRISNKRWMN